MAKSAPEWESNLHTWESQSFLIENQNYIYTHSSTVKVEQCSLQTQIMKWSGLRNQINMAEIPNRIKLHEYVVYVYYISKNIINFFFIYI